MLVLCAMHKLEKQTNPRWLADVRLPRKQPKLCPGVRQTDTSAAVLDAAAHLQSARTLPASTNAATAVRCAVGRLDPASGPTSGGRRLRARASAMTCDPRHPAACPNTRSPVQLPFLSSMTSLQPSARKLHHVDASPHSAGDATLQSSLQTAPHSRALRVISGGSS